MSAPDSTPAREDETPGLSSRRAFLGRAAAGAAAGGLVWAAPSILTIDAAAAASCGPNGTHTLNWGSKATGSGAGTWVSTGGTPLNVTVAGTASSPSPASNGGLGNNFTTTTSQIGNQTAASWYMQMRATSSTQFLTTTITFPAGTGVNGLSFKMFDIDYSRANSFNFQDVITITGTTRTGTAAHFSAAAGSAITVAGNGTTSLGLTGTVTNNPADGQPTDSVLGNATITSPDSVRIIVIKYSPGVRLTAEPYQYVGVGNLTWTTCT